MVSILTENATNPQGRDVVIVAICFLSFTWPILGLRFWVRHCMLHRLWADDVFALLAQIMFTGYCVSLMVTIHISPGANPASIPIAEKAVTAFTASETTYAFSMLFLKLSLCAFFLRILISRLQRSLVYVIIAISTIINLIEGIWINFMCGVPDGKFVPKILAHQCAPRKTQAGIAYSQATVNTFTDVALATIPVWLLWRMQMKIWTKVSVGGILILATSGCVASMVRFKYIPLILDATLGFYRTVAPLMMICIIELGTGLLACSLATLRPLLASLIDITAPSRYTLSNIISKSQHKENNDTTTSRTLKKQQNNDLSSLQNKTGDLESGEDNELQVFEPKSATFLAKERGRSEGSDVSLVYTK